LAGADEIKHAIYSAADKHGIEPELLYAIYAHESKLKLDAVNKKTQDYGLAQINIRNIKARNWDKKRILTDAKYSAERGAIILSEFKKRYAKREPDTWVCRYNIGNRNKNEKRWRSRCLNYLKKVKSVLES
jgi:soluble lytic murein transglycosylase-like protein